ncbi:LOW QUALITY PROTEIN: intracellular hyaluronan-binding protein 4.L-like, partial [Glossina fuscipes fuscipes]
KIVKAVDKCDGSGAQNWGSVKDIIDEVNTKNNNNEDNANLAAYTSGGTEKIDETINDQPQSNEHEHVEEEVKELTLDEWKAQQQQRAKPQFNIHKAGEGEDTSPWKKMIVLNNNKKKENESEEELEFEYDPAMYPQRVGRQQRILDIQFNFNDGRRIGSGFGGRGRGGGRGGGGGGGTNAPRSTGNNNNDSKPRATGGGSAGGISGTDANNLGAGGGGRGGKRQFTSDKHQQNLALKVNDER